MADSTSKKKHVLHQPSLLAGLGAFVPKVFFRDGTEVAKTDYGKFINMKWELCHDKAKSDFFQEAQKEWDTIKDLAYAKQEALEKLEDKVQKQREAWNKKRAPVWFIQKQQASSHNANDDITESTRFASKHTVD